MPQHLILAISMFALAVLVDRVLGEYPNRLHPVVWIGWLISAGLKAAPPRGWSVQFFFGVVFTLAVIALVVRLTWLALAYAAISPILEILVGAYLLKASFAWRELTAAAERVERALEDSDLPTARAALPALCSRDPAELNAEELAAAAIESLAENTSDSIIAPLFYFVLFGIPAALGYRAVNTLDARIGYRGRFEALGKFAARLDDVVNWIPARLTAVLLLFAGACTGGDIRNGWKMLRRDARKTPSPNGGRPMAAMAGLLRVALMKRDVYVLGEPLDRLDFGKIARSRRMVNVAALFMIGLVLAVIVAAGWNAGGLPFVGVAGGRILPYIHSNAEE